MHLVPLVEASAVHPEFGRFQATRRHRHRRIMKFWDRVRIHTMAINAAIRECINY